MKLIREVRRENLQQLANDFKSQSAFSVASGISPAYVSHLLNKRKDGTYVKELGHNLARKIEDKLALTHGWLDTDHINDQEKEKQEGNVVEVEQLEKELDPLSMIIANMSKKMSETNKLKIIESMREKIELQNYRRMNKSN
ncbi:MAG: hypothetical protein HAW67_07475 [Endozoicomonadaceae bacterium]|nr:hypothetical protein [Endozoicomonadaceae bacterium]